MPKIRRILCATDFTATAESAIRTALALAERLDAEVHLVHVVRAPDPLIQKQEFVAWLAGEHRKKLGQLVEEHAGKGVALTGHLEEGVPHRAITALATKLDADLIVLGTHGRSGLAHAILGSVAERVLRTATTPVLIVPPRDAG